MSPGLRLGGAYWTPSVDLNQNWRSEYQKLRISVGLDTPRPPESDIPVQGPEIHVLTDSLGNSAATTMGSPPPSLISGTPDQERNPGPVLA